MRNLYLFLFLLFFHPGAGNIFGKKKRVADTFEDVLKDAGLNRKFKSAFLERGWDNTPQVLRGLSRMDLKAVGMSEKEMNKLYASIEKLVPPSARKGAKAKKIDKALELRKSLTYGRLYVDGAAGSFQFMKAGFGGDIPLKSHEIVFGGFGCQAVDNAAGSMLVVKRGECTYLQKAEAAEESGASALVVVNSDNGDLFPLPAGHELTYEELDDLPVVPTVLVQKSALKMLDKLEDLDPFAKAILIPQQCDDDGCMSVYKSDRAFMAHFDATGGELHLTSLNGREVRMDFVASSFGITVPDEGELIISDPIESCGEIDVDVAAAMPGKAVIVKRGGCSFYDKIKEVQKHQGRMIIMVDNEEQSVLDRIGVTTEQLSDIYLPVLMVSRSKGSEILEIVKEKEMESLPSILHVSKIKEIGIKWEELRNFFANCVPQSDDAVDEVNYVQCNKDFQMLEKSSEGFTDRQTSLKKYQIVDVTDVDVSNAEKTNPGAEL